MNEDLEFSQWLKILRQLGAICVYTKENGIGCYMIGPDGTQVFFTKSDE